MNLPPKIKIPPLRPRNIQVLPQLPVPGWFSYAGRYTRTQFWYRWIPVGIVMNVASSVFGSVYGDHIGQKATAALANGADISDTITQLYIMGIAEIALYTLIFLPLLVKRLHDIGLSAAAAVIIWCLLQGVGGYESYSYIQGLNETLQSGSIAEMMDLMHRLEKTENNFMLIRLIIVIPMLIILCLDSQKGTNLYGPSHKYPEAEPNP